MADCHSLASAAASLSLSPSSSSSPLSPSSSLSSGRRNDTVQSLFADPVPELSHPSFTDSEILKQSVLVRSRWRLRCRAVQHATWRALTLISAPRDLQTLLTGKGGEHGKEGNEEREEGGDTGEAFLLLDPERNAISMMDEEESGEGRRGEEDHEEEREGRETSKGKERGKRSRARKESLSQTKAARLGEEHYAQAQHYETKGTSRLVGWWFFPSFFLSSFIY